VLRNGTPRSLLDTYSRLNYLMAHNIDTVGADLEAAPLGWHVEQGAARRGPRRRQPPPDLPAFGDDEFRLRSMAARFRDRRHTPISQITRILLTSTAL
jgi:hypothetical protein